MSVERLTLEDGRVLEYAIKGEPSWPLLVLYLGSPSAVTEFPHVSEAAARRNVRTVVCSRPGYGASSRHPGRGVADAAADMRQLADHLNAATFMVAGWSGGGPYALACAALLGPRVRACMTLAGVAPVADVGEDWRAWYSEDDQRDLLALRAGALEELTGEYEAAAEPFRQVTATTILEWPANSDTDVSAMRSVPAAAESLARSMREATWEQVWGWLDDASAFARPWGFALGDVSVLVAVRHGDGDRIVSIDQGRWLADHLPNARLDEVAGGGHTSVAVPFEPVVDALLHLASEDAVPPR